MADNELWENLIDPKNLKRGWHLVRNDSRQDFVHRPTYLDDFSANYDEGISEIRRRLQTDTYTPAPLVHADVPKGSMAVRPGSVPQVEDRIVLQTIIYLLALKIDPNISKSVYSYRLKKKISKGSIFQESDVLDIPFIKKSIVSSQIDPFESWYLSWPEFDRVSRAAFEEDGYEYLAVSDISAYFENIQLPLLRDQILKFLNGEQKIVNFLFRILETWGIKTPEGRSYLRGIPQGTQISSFLGNIYLVPLDSAFEEFGKIHDIKYFRYMDDVKVFAKGKGVARRSILEMDRVIRQLHLNVQSAKTEILEESRNKEISRSLVDSRLDEIDFIMDQIEAKKSKGKEFTSQEQAILLNKLKGIATKKPVSESEQVIIGSRKALSGLSLRVFRRWMTAHQALGSHVHVTRLMQEIERNPDNRVTRKLVATTRQFPRKSQIKTRLFQFLNSPLNIYPHQEAEIIWAFRYLSQIDKSLVNYCEKKFLDANVYYYVRMQSAHLLSRTLLQESFLKKAEKIFEEEPNPLVQIASAGLLMQRTEKKNGAALARMVFHPNEDIRKSGRFLRQMKFDEKQALSKIRYILDANFTPRACDYFPELFAASQSDRIKILEELQRSIRDYLKVPGIRGIRPILSEILRRAEKSLSSISP